MKGMDCVDDGQLDGDVPSVPILLLLLEGIVQAGSLLPLLLLSMLHSAVQTVRLHWLLLELVHLVRLPLVQPLLRGCPTDDGRGSSDRDMQVPGRVKAKEREKGTYVADGSRW